MCLCVYHNKFEITYSCTRLVMLPTGWFTKTNRLRLSTLEHWLPDGGGAGAPVEGHLHLTLPDLVTNGWTWSTVYNFLDDDSTLRVVWVQPHDAFLIPGGLDDIFGQQPHFHGYTRRISVQVLTVTGLFMNTYSDSYENYMTVSVYANSPAQAALTIDDLFRLIPSSRLEGLRLVSNQGEEFPLDSYVTRQFLEANQHLKTLQFLYGTFSEEHCRVIADTMRTTHLHFREAQLRDDGRALIECLRNNQGPTRLTLDDTQISEHNLEAIVDSIQANQQLKRLGLSDMKLTNQLVQTLSATLRKNRWLVELDLTWNSISDENWSDLNLTIRDHPTLQALNLYATTNAGVGEIPTSRKISRTLAIWDMVRKNEILQEINLSSTENDENLMPNIRGCLVLNQHRPKMERLCAETVYQRQTLLGRALVAAGRQETYGPDLQFLLVSRNVETILAAPRQSRPFPENKRARVI